MGLPRTSLETLELVERAIYLAQHGRRAVPENEKKFTCITGSHRISDVVVYRAPPFAISYERERLTTEAPLRLQKARLVIEFEGRPVFELGRPGVIHYEPGEWEGLLTYRFDFEQWRNHGRR